MKKVSEVVFEEEAAADTQKTASENKKNEGMFVGMSIFDCPSSLLSDSSFLGTMIQRIVEGIGMTPVKKSMAFYHFPIMVKEKPCGEYGISGGCILVESHVYLHTWPERGFMRLEISSCKPVSVFNATKVIKIFLGRNICVKTEAVDW